MPARSSLLFAVAVGLVGLAGAADPAPAQSPRGRSEGGFDYTLPATASGEELSAQSNLWVMEVEFKNMRLVRLPVTDPETGATANELVWYLVWRATNRPLRTPERDLADDPVNATDGPPGGDVWVPELVLIAEDSGNEQFRDVVLPDAVARIESRELRGAYEDVTLNTTVAAAGTLPALTDRTPEARPGDGAVYGVATWTGIDPETDRFTVLLNGFSNGYEQASGPDGAPIVNRRTGILRFWRPGDAVDEREQEFRLGTDPRGGENPLAALPRWEYLPRPTPAPPTATPPTSPSPKPTRTTSPAGSEARRPGEREDGHPAVPIAWKWPARASYRQAYAGYSRA